MVDIKNIIKESKLLIFDFDGTIADTEPLHWKAHKEVLKKYGIVLSEKDIQKYIGHNDNQIYEMINNDFNVDINIENAKKLRIKKFSELAERYNLQPFKKIKDIILNNTEKNLKILTSQKKDIVEMLLKQWEIYDFFEEIISLAEIKKMKLEVLSELESGTPELLLFEDTPRIIKEAMEKNIKCVTVKHKYNSDLVSNNEYIINTMNEKKGLFVGSCTLDYVYYIKEFVEDNDKLNTNNYKRYIGGQAANSAVTYSLLGGNAVLATCLGESEESKMMLKILNGFGVTVLNMAKDKIMPSISSIFVTENGNRTICSGQAVFRELDIIELDNYEFSFFDCYQQNMSLKVMDATEKNIVIDAESWDEYTEKYLKKADVIIASEKFRDMNNKNLFERDLEKAKHKIITRGEKSVLTDKFEVDVPQVRCVDSLGAGDVFHGAFCYAFYDKEEDFRIAIEFATKVASESVKYYGPREWAMKEY